MYEFLQPPTDNLYKFLAIFGLVLIGLSVYVFDTETSKLITDTQQAELNGIITRVERLEQEVDNAGKERVREIAKELESAKVGLVEIVTEIDSTLTLILWVSGCLLFVGAAISLFGFVVWYFRLQRHLDRILGFQLKEAERSEASATKRAG